MDKSIARTAKATTGLKNAFSALAGLSIAGFGIQKLVQSSDELQLLTDKMQLFANEGQTGLEVMKNVSQAASRQGQSISDLATMYSRVQLGSAALNLTSEQTLAVTEALAQSFRIAGSSGTEMRGAVIQLSQGLAAGALQGQELRSVMEGNAILAVALREKFKGLMKEGENIFKFAERRGGIKANEIFEVLAENTGKFDKLAKGLSFTLGQSLNIALNTLAIRWTELNNKLEITKTIANSVIWAVNNMNIVLPVLATILTAAVYPALAGAASALSTYVGGVIAATTATGALATAMGVISGVLKAVVSIKGAVVIAIGAIVYALLNWENAQRILGLGVAKLGLYLSKFDEIIANATIGLGKFFNSTSMIEDGTKRLAFSAQNIKKFEADIVSLSTVVEKTQEEFDKNGILTSLAEITANDGSKIKMSLKDLNMALEGTKISLAQYTDAVKKLRLEEVQALYLEGKIDKAEKERRDSEIINGKTRDLSRLNAAVAALNREYLKTGDASAYFRNLDNAVIEDTASRFEQGRIQLEEYLRSMDTKKITGFNDSLRNGKINIMQYDQAIRNIKMESLQRQFDSNRITLEEYNAEMIKLEEMYQPGSAFFTGTMNYIRQAGTVSQGAAQAVQNAFGALENGLMDFIRTGKFEFSKFTQSILDDINRIIVRSMIVRPLAQGIMGGADAYASTAGFADGGAFSGKGVQFYAKGGIVNAPTMFRHSGGLGVAGEAGPEAIVPLKRGSDGSLGVAATSANVTVNVINQTPDTETRQVERTGDSGERIIDVIILNRVKEGFANGAFDKQLSSQYGLRRKGG